jgi:transcription elongation factor GreA
MNGSGSGSPDGHGLVKVGAWVTVRDGDVEESWRIVARHEADAFQRRISEDTPLARALLGHCAGERVRVDGPAGRRPVTILAVE